jgi:hypothetical protein
VNCPDCESALRDPNRCRCGWARNTDTVNVTLCSRCNVSAMVKHKVGDSWINFCLQHADEYRAEESRAYCEAKGLHSMAEIKGWLKKQPLAKRIPIQGPGGGDYEEDAA